MNNINQYMRYEYMLNKFNKENRNLTAAMPGFMNNERKSCRKCRGFGDIYIGNSKYPVICPKCKGTGFEE